MLAVAGVLGAISLAGIFVVYLVNTIGDNNDGQTTAAVATPGATGATGGTGAASANGAAGSSPPAAATPPAAAGKTGATPPAAAGGTPPGPGLNVIPRNQVFTTFTNRSAGYSILYPKGWVKKGVTTDLQFVHNNDFIRIATFNSTVP